jgi:hypothetical protein
LAANPQPRSAAGHVLSTPVGGELLRLFDSLTRGRPLRMSSRPFPVAVLEAGDDQVNVGDYLDALARVAGEAGVPHISIAPDTDAEDAELRLLDAISEESAWNAVRPPSGPFRFPRSDFVKSLEAAVRRAPAGEVDAAIRAWNDGAALFPWSRGPFKAPVWWSTIGVSLAAVFTVLFGGITQGLADKAQTPVLLAVVGGLLAAVLIMTGLMTRRVWLPVLSRIGFGTRYRWLAASSFFAVLGGNGFDGRLRRVFGRLVTQGSDEFGLQMKTFAFLEDLRAGHRKLSPSLRGLKRPMPPVVFLRGITAANGGVELLSAMSDIRSRRSELHPLLVIASVDHEHRRELDRLVRSDPSAPDSIEGRYEEWEARLGTSQAPSQQVALPWLLRLPVPAEHGALNPPPPLKSRRRPRWTWLWSWRSLIAALVVIVLGGLYLHGRLNSEYCRVDLLFRGNPDTRLRTDADGSRECVGVATGDVRFEQSAESTGLDGNRRRPSPSNRGAQLTLADLQNKIASENARVLHSHRPYVTALYAGMLTAAEGSEQSAVSSIRQLAGAYLAQVSNNDSDQPGEVGNPLKIRLLPVNVGQNMYFSAEVTDRMLAMARRDRTVVGVIGMERNTAASQAAITQLTDAGLPVIDTANSSDVLPTRPHYYGIASTDHDEAVAAQYAARQAFGSRAVRAMIVSRAPGPSHDQYSSELAADVGQELRRASPSSVTYGGIDDIAAKVRAECESTAGRPYELVYFAGRAEDLPGLISGLQSGGCTSHPLTLMGGDEVSRATFGGGQHEILLPPRVTVYFTIFTHLPDLTAGSEDLNSPFLLLTRNILGIDQPQPLLADGQMAVTYDAASALSQAAQEAYSTLDLTRHNDDLIPGSQAVTSGSVLLELPSLTMKPAVTGTVDFTHDGHTRNGAGNRGLTLVKVTMSGAAPKYEPICGRMNGGGHVPALKPC